jgi:hypothetical protein
MYARIRSYRINDGQVDERLKHARETSVDAYRNQKGFQGVVILVDPSEHKNVTVGFWDTEADMFASEQADGNSAHRRYAAGDVTTEHFEVRGRNGETGSFARVRTYQIAPGQIDSRLRHSQDVAVPYWSRVPGRTGYLVLIDPASHKNITIAFFDTEANMMASEAHPKGQSMLANQPHISGPHDVEHFQVGHAE